MTYTSGTTYWRGGEKPRRKPELKLKPEVLALILDSIEHNRPIIFSGTTGVGKTTAMLEIDFLTSSTEKPEAFIPSYLRPWMMIPNWWTRAVDYGADVRQGWNYARQYQDWGENYSADGIASQVKRLFLDDLGQERDNDTSLVASLIDTRTSRELPTWVTTNLNVPELCKRYGERTMSRLMEGGQFVQMTGVDHRLVKEGSA